MRCVATLLRPVSQDVANAHLAGVGITRAIQVCHGGPLNRTGGGLVLHDTYHRGPLRFSGAFRHSRLIAKELASTSAR